MLGKIGIILVIFSFQTSASDSIAVYELERKLRPYEDLWNTYKSDNCTMHSIRNSNEFQQRANGLRRCRDGSPSFVQPPSTGYNGWEGKCGQTLASNMVYSLCKKVLDPDRYFTPVLRDFTPGVRPGTFIKGLKKTFSDIGIDCPILMGRWSFNSLSENDYIESIKNLLVPSYSHRNQLNIRRNGVKYKRNPVGLLIQNPGGKLIHWVLAIDIIDDNNECNLVINHWDNQYTVPCETIKLWAKRVGRTYPVVLKSYSIVSYY